ncbi:Peroxidase [Zostera marina]|uniref:Peroxidase n=1 Tax=Zostera marina TaxID=29655 RepID=A0A0K9PKV8_ZOSMR|nr:Peroxidase [Zostera marina]
MAASSFKLAILGALFLLLLPLTTSALSSHYYSKSCPKLFKVVRPVMVKAIQKQARNGASILRLFFHDCFVNGCDASLLLDDTPTFTGEKTSRANNNSARGFDIIDDIKNAVEQACPGVVSCADILAIASLYSVQILGGPTWKLKLGRLDARTASLELANANLPPPFLDLDGLNKAFKKVGLSQKDMVVLSGGHTIGLARCISFRNHIYNDTDIDPKFAANRQKTCPRSGGDNNLAPLDTKSPRIFDNYYYKNLVRNRGLLHSDQAIYNGVDTDDLVLKYSKDECAFFEDFGKSMIKMGNIKPVDGTPLEIRKNCRVVN